MAVDPEVRRLQKLAAAKRNYATPKGRELALRYGREYYRKNRDARLQYEKTRYERDETKARVRNNHFLRTYGITLDQYLARFTEQGGLCAICRKAETAMFRGQPKMLAVDHDHATGAVRGLLCANCNIVLGAARDNVEFLRRAIEYLAPTMIGGTHHAVDG